MIEVPEVLLISSQLLQHLRFCVDIFFPLIKLIIFTVSYSNVIKIELYFVSVSHSWVVSVQPKRNVSIPGLNIQNYS